MVQSTILIADDDRAIRTVLNEALGRLGHDVKTTGHAARSGSGSRMVKVIW